VDSSVVRASNRYVEGHGFHDLPTMILGRLVASYNRSYLLGLLWHRYCMNTSIRNIESIQCGDKAGAQNDCIVFVVTCKRNGAQMQRIKASPEFKKKKDREESRLTLSWSRQLTYYFFLSVNGWMKSWINSWINIDANMGSLFLLHVSVYNIMYIKTE